MGPSEVVASLGNDLKRLITAVTRIVTPNRVFGVPEQIIVALFITHLVLKAPPPSVIIDLVVRLGTGNIFCAFGAIGLGLTSGLLSPDQWAILFHGVVDVLAAIGDLLSKPSEPPGPATDVASHMQGDQTIDASLTAADTATDRVIDKGKQRDTTGSGDIPDTRTKSSLSEEEKAEIMRRRLAEKRKAALRAQTEATGVGPSFAAPEKREDDQMDGVMSEGEEASRLSQKKSMRPEGTNRSPSPTSRSLHRPTEDPVAGPVQASAQVSTRSNAADQEGTVLQGSAASLPTAGLSEPTKPAQKPISTSHDRVAKAGSQVLAEAKERYERLCLVEQSKREAMESGSSGDGELKAAYLHARQRRKEAEVSLAQLKSETSSRSEVDTSSRAQVKAAVDDTDAITAKEAAGRIESEVHVESSVAGSRDKARAAVLADYMHEKAAARADASHTTLITDDSSNSVSTAQRKPTKPTVPAKSERPGPAMVEEILDDDAPAELPSRRLPAASQGFQPEAVSRTVSQEKKEAEGPVGATDHGDQRASESGGAAIDLAAPENRPLQRASAADETPVDQVAQAKHKVKQLQMIEQLKLKEQEAASCPDEVKRTAYRQARHHRKEAEAELLKLRDKTIPVRFELNSRAQESCSKESERSAQPAQHQRTLSEEATKPSPVALGMVQIARDLEEPVSAANPTSAAVDEAKEEVKWLYKAEQLKRKELEEAASVDEEMKASYMKARKRRKEAEVFLQKLKNESLREAVKSAEEEDATADSQEISAQPEKALKQAYRTSAASPSSTEPQDKGAKETAARGSLPTAVPQVAFKVARKTVDDTDLPYHQSDKEPHAAASVTREIQALRDKQRAEERVIHKYLAKKQAALREEKPSKPTGASELVICAHSATAARPAPAEQPEKSLKSALKKPSVTFAGIPEPEELHNEVPNYFLTKRGPSKPALVPFPHGLYPKAGKPPGTLWFNKIPSDASQLTAPIIRARRESAA